jgi:hypothetical protein
MVDNPQWIALRQELSELRQRHADLLVKRTPLHPAVQDVARRIASLQQQLAATERQIPNPQADSAAQARLAAADYRDHASHGAPAVPAAAQAPAADNPAENEATERAARGIQERLDALSAAAEGARRACHQSELAQRQAVREQEAGPRLAIESAQVVRNPSQVDYGWWRLLGTALAAGVVMAFGAGSLSLGVAIESPEVSVAEVQADLGEPLIGIIPADDLAPAAAKVNRQRRVRRTAITIGLLLIAVCPLVAVWGVLGI